MFNFIVVKINNCSFVYLYGRVCLCMEQCQTIECCMQYGKIVVGNAIHCGKSHMAYRPIVYDTIYTASLGKNFSNRDHSFLKPRHINHKFPLVTVYLSNYSVLTYSHRPRELARRLSEINSMVTTPWPNPNQNDRPARPAQLLRFSLQF